MVSAHRRLRASLLAVPFLWLGAQAASADEHAPEPSGTVEIKSTSVGAGLGINWGQGTLTKDGMNYAFKLNGLKALAVGVGSVHATGNVYHLEDPEKLAGTYRAYEGSIAVIGGVGGVNMRNEHGVVMRLSSKTWGLDFQQAGGKVTVELLDTPPVAAPPPGEEAEPAADSP